MSYKKQRCVCHAQDLLGVTPVIGLLDDVSNFRAVVNPHEVESLFEAPLEMFLKVR